MTEEEMQKATAFVEEQMKGETFDQMLLDAKKSSKAVAIVKTTYDLCKAQFELSPQVTAMLTIAVMIAKKND